MLFLPARCRCDELTLLPFPHHQGLEREEQVNANEGREAKDAAALAAGDRGDDEECEIGWDRDPPGQRQMVPLEPVLPAEHRQVAGADCEQDPAPVLEIMAVELLLLVPAGGNTVEAASNRFRSR